MLTINSLIVIQPVQSRAFTTTRADSGFSTQAMTVSGYTDRTASLAAAKEVARQLNEMASNYWYRVVHIADSEDSQYDGHYVLQGATVTATPTTSNSNAALFSVSVTLLRLGGMGASGANVTHRVSTMAAVNVNSYGITALAYTPTPVGAYPLPVTATSFVNRTSEDGTMSGLAWATPSPLAFTMTGADVNKGECQLWDTAPTPDIRVWSADHAFANDADLMLDNGLVRVTALAADGFHAVQIWDSTASAWVDVLSSGGSADGANIGGTSTHTCRQVTVDELSPWRITVTWTYSISVTPYLWTKTITIERGKHTATIVYTPAAAATIIMRPMETTFIVTRRTADSNSGYHSTVQTAATLSTTTDNLLIGFNATTDKVLRLAAVSTTAPAASVVASAARITGTTVTSLTVWLGGVAYDCTKAQMEAEAGTLSGGATLTSALANDSGNSAVQLDAASEQVALTALASPPVGTRVMAWFRIASSIAAASGNAGDILTLAIWNNTAGSAAATTTIVANNATFFGTVSTLVWAAVEYTSWNGTDVLYPFANKTSSATVQAFVIDEVIWLTLNAAGNYDRPRDLATLALTDQYFWESVDRAIW